MKDIKEIESRLNAIYTRQLQLQKEIEPLEKEYKKLAFEAGDLSELLEDILYKERTKLVIDFFHNKNKVHNPLSILDKP